MKLYKFYKNPDSDIINSKLSNTLKYPLYAFTRYKNVAEEFEKLHRKGIFKLIITEVDKDEFKEFAKDNRGCALEYKPLDSYIRTNNVKLTYDILMTYNEYMYVDSISDPDSLTALFDGFIFVNSCIFRKKVNKILKELFYHRLFLMHNLEVNFDDYSEEELENYMETIEDISWEYNTLNIYIMLYYDILDIDVLLTKLV